MAGKKYGAPALVISADEVDDLLKPYVVEVAGDVIALKSKDSFTIDDYGDVVDMAAEDIAKAVGVIAADEESADKLRKLGISLLRRILDGWIAATGVTPGESESSEA